MNLSCSAWLDRSSSNNIIVSDFVANSYVETRLTRSGYTGVFGDVPCRFYSSTGRRARPAPPDSWLQLYAKNQCQGFGMKELASNLSAELRLSQELTLRIPVSSFF